MRVPDITLPSPLARLAERLPAAPPSWAFSKALNLLVRRGVIPADMNLLAGRRFEFHITDAGIRLRLLARHDRFQLDTEQRTPDLRMAASFADFTRMMLREEDPDTLFFSRKLVIEGDTELGLIVKNLLDSVDWSRTPLARFMAA